MCERRWWWLRGKRGGGDRIQSKGGWNRNRFIGLNTRSTDLHVIPRANYVIRVEEERFDIRVCVQVRRYHVRDPDEPAQCIGLLSAQEQGGRRRISDPDSRFGSDGVSSVRVHDTGVETSTSLSTHRITV